MARSQEKTVEIHELKLDNSVEVKVEITDAGTVWIYIGSELMDVDAFAQVIEFIRTHGRVDV